MMIGPFTKLRKLVAWLEKLNSNELTALYGKGMRCKEGALSD